MTPERRARRLSKDAVRERVWRLMRDRQVARFPGAEGRIPNFVRAERAARLFASTDAWQAAQILKCNPDAPQLPVRATALGDGKVVYMAVPRLLEPKPFLRLDPRRIDVSARAAASIRGATSAGVPVTPKQVRRIDLVVCGTVAVNRQGVRIGKGGGYSDLEFALLAQIGRIDARTTIATTVHDVQVLDEDLPETAHDFRVDLIVTPDEVIETNADRRRRPSGIVWSHLEDQRIDAIPALRALRPRR